MTSIRDRTLMLQPVNGGGTIDADGGGTSGTDGGETSDADDDGAADAGTVESEPVNGQSDDVDPLSIAPENPILIGECPPGSVWDAERGECVELTITDPPGSAPEEFDPGTLADGDGDGDGMGFGTLALLAVAVGALVWFSRR